MPDMAVRPCTERGHEKSCVVATPLTQKGKAALSRFWWYVDGCHFTRQAANLRMLEAMTKE